MLDKLQEGLSGTCRIRYETQIKTRTVCIQRLTKSSADDVAMSEIIFFKIQLTGPRGLRAVRCCTGLQQTPIILIYHSTREEQCFKTLNRNIESMESPVGKAQLFCAKLLKFSKFEKDYLNILFKHDRDNFQKNGKPAAQTTSTDFSIIFRNTNQQRKVYGRIFLQVQNSLKFFYQFISITRYSKRYLLIQRATLNESSCRV